MAHHFLRLGLLIVLTCQMFPAVAEVDSVALVLDPEPGIGGKSLGTFGYDPQGDRMYVTAFGGGTSPGNGVLVRFEGISTGQPTSTTLASEAQVQLFYRDGDPDRSVTTPIQSGLLLNPLPVADRPAYSFAVIADAASTRFPASNTVDPAATKRIYTYSLEPVVPPGDGRDVFSTLVTLGEMQAIAGKTSTSSSVGRQFAWSGDGQSVYFVDSSSVYNGLWKAGVVSGDAELLLAADLEIAEPAVRSAGGVDTIFFGGGGATDNLGGIDFVTYDGTTVSSRQIAVPAAAIREFHETTADAKIVSIALDAQGNIYYSNSTSASSTAGTPTQRGLYRYDTEGRIAKVVSHAERQAVFGDRGNVNATLARLQPRTVTYAGSEGDFDMVQLLYGELSSVNAVAGAFAFKPGDFNRDNVVDADDVALFAPQVTLRGVAKTEAADLKFDFNANNAVDWKDVQIFQQFLEYGSPTIPDPALRIFADADFNGVVDFADFRTMRDAMGQSGQTFLAGDFDGNDRVDFADFQLLDRGYGAVSDLIGSGVTPTPFDQAEWDAFVETVQIGLDVADGVTTTQFDLSYPRIMQACAVTKTGLGELLFTGANAYTGPTTVAAGTLRLFNAEAAVNSAVTVADGATLSVGPAVRAEVAGLAVDPAGLVDLTTGRLTVADGVDATALRTALQAGRNGGNWDGTTGITSSAVGSSGTRAVGYTLGADGSAVVAFAAPGDVDLDGKIDAFDLVGINASATFGNGQPAIWSQGDFNYDGFTNALDLVAINAAGVFNRGSYLPLAEASPLASVSAVPEPGSVAMLVTAAAAAGGLIRRRNKTNPL